tara:strand:- start:166 stop:561 length:396 start_codon:yes stop_codon:yes gene_type:complete
MSNKWKRAKYEKELMNLGKSITKNVNNMYKLKNERSNLKQKLRNLNIERYQSSTTRNMEKRRRIEGEIQNTMKRNENVLMKLINLEQQAKSKKKDFKEMLKIIPKLNKEYSNKMAKQKAIQRLTPKQKNKM